MKLGKVLVYNGFAVIFLTRLDFDLFFVVDFIGILGYSIYFVDFSHKDM